jgi:hypothetical protein
MEFIQLSKDVLLVKNSVEDPQRLYDIIKKSKQEEVNFFGPWTDWKPWGNYSKAYPRVDAGWRDCPSDGGYFIRENLKSFFAALKYYKENCLNEEYFKLWGEDPNIPTSWEELIDMPGYGRTDVSKFKNPHRWEYGDLLIAESVNTNPKQSLSMELHKDRRMWLNPAPSFFNYNVYINDDYEGGEIQFIDFENAEKSTYIDQNGEEKECWMIDDPLIYKMEAGDGMLFRTDHPHSVFPIKGNKYYVRHFLIAPQPQELISYKETLSDEDFFAKLAEIEKDGFENKQWHGRLFATKEDIDSTGHPREQKYVLKSGNKSLVSNSYRFVYEEGESPTPIYVTDPLYDFNPRGEAKEL